MTVILIAIDISEFREMQKILFHLVLEIQTIRVCTKYEIDDGF